MDPQACIDKVFEDIADDEYDDAAEGLMNYFNWRRGGGFEPHQGDDRFQIAICRLARRATMYRSTVINRVTA